MIKASAVGTKSGVTTTAKTFKRVTFLRAGFVAFDVECFGIDPTAKKVIAELYKGSTSGTPGSNVTFVATDSDSETPSLLATVANVFTDESGYSAGSLVARPTIHPQYNRTTVVVSGNAGDTFDLRLVQDATGTGVDAQVTTRIQSK